MGRRWLVLVVLAAGCVVCQGRTYTSADLPAGWGIDPNRIQGVLLPAVSTDPAGVNDPDPALLTTWLAPIGAWRREAPTNRWVSHATWVGTQTSDTVEVHYHADLGYSERWVLDGWARPGPNYKVLDVHSFRGWSGQTKAQRVTVVVVGVIPDDAFPVVY